MHAATCALTRRSAAAFLASIGAALMLALGLPARAHAGTFTPVADAYVDSASPATNYGRSVSLKTDASPVLNAYMRFNVAGVGPTTSAKLKVHAETASSTGFQVRSVTGAGADTWGETSINFNNAPALGPVIASVSGVKAGTWYMIDVSSAVSGDGLVTLALTSTSSTGIRYSSREGATSPELITPAPPLDSYLVSGSGGSYQALSQTGGPSFSGTLKSVLNGAVSELEPGGGGTVTFSAGTFDFGSERFEGHSGLANITFQGQGIAATVVRNDSSLATDTEPFDMSISFGIVIRDMTIHAGGPFRSTSDAIDFDGGNEVVIERVEVTGSRGRGIVFDGKDMKGSLPRTADHNVIRDCVITGVPSDGIELLAAQHNRIEGCTIANAGGHGIQLAKASASAGQPHKKPSENVVTGNSVTNAGQDGINVTSGDLNQIVGNTVFDSSNLTAGRDGIRILSADSIACDDNVVQGNRSGDNQTPKTQRYGLQIASALCHRSVVSGNDFSGNLSGPIRDLGTGTQYP